MSGTFPDTTNFKTLSFRDTKTTLKNTDSNNKLYEKFLRQHWELALKSTLLTRAQLGTAYGFIAKQNGNAETLLLYPQL